jgi:hypothetical protein
LYQPQEPLHPRDKHGSLTLYYQVTLNDDQQKPISRDDNQQKDASLKPF